jgi:bacterioferritin (cytochrome b1)
MSIGKETLFVDTLKHLVALDYDAISAYQAAVDRLESSRYRRALREFMTDHWRHIQELTPIVSEFGEAAPTHPDAKVVLTKGKVLIGQIAGDRGILSAMRSNENDTNLAYENACSRIDVPVNIREILQRSLMDERRHRAWLERVLTQSPGTTVSTSAPYGTPL